MDTFYVDRVTHVEAEWANDVNDLVYKIFDAAKTKREARLALGIDPSNVDISGGQINGTTIGLTVPAPGHFPWIKIDQLPIDPLHGTNKRYVDSLFAASNSGSFLLERDVPVIGTSVGAVDDGYLFLEGTSFTEFVVIISTKTLFPGYTAPTLSINGAPAPGIYEIGTIFPTISISSSFSANDSGGLAAGTPGSYHFSINGAVTPGASPQNAPVLSGVLLGNTPIQYSMTVDYLAGPIKNDNQGNPSPSGRILAGSTGSNTLTYTGARKAFFGTPGSTPSSSAAIRSLAANSFNSGNNGEVDSDGVSLVPAPSPNFIITIPIGATRVVFAYPATSRAVASVKYQELSDSEVKANFVETSVLVEGADGFTSVAYRVFTYIPVEPFSLVNRYKVFI